MNVYINEKNMFIIHSIGKIFYGLFIKYKYTYSLIKTKYEV